MTTVTKATAKTATKTAKVSPTLEAVVPKTKAVKAKTLATKSKESKPQPSTRKKAEKVDTIEVPKTKAPELDPKHKELVDKMAELGQSQLGINHRWTVLDISRQELVVANAKLNLEEQEILLAQMEQDAKADHLGIRVGVLGTNSVIATAMIPATTESKKAAA